MQKIRPFLWFNDNAEEAAKHYISIFKNSKILSTSYYGDSMPNKKGQVMVVTFQLEGQELMALNGGPEFKFTEAISLLVSCETQQEIDELTDKLTAGGGAIVECGWVKDKYGLRWQIVPSFLDRLMTDKDRTKVDRMMAAIWSMKKLDIAAIKRAFDGQS